MRSFGWALIQCDCCPCRRRLFGCIERQEGRRPAERPCEDTGKRQLSVSRGKRPQEGLNLLTSWSWISCLQNCEKLNLRCLSHPIWAFCYGSHRRLMHSLYQNLCFFPLLSFSFLSLIWKLNLKKISQNYLCWSIIYKETLKYPLSLRFHVTWI